MAPARARAATLLLIIFSRTPLQVAVGEDEPNITDEVGEDAIVFGVLVEECLDSAADLETLDFNR